MSTLKVNSIIPVAGVPTGGGGGIVQIKQTVITDTKSYTANSHTYTDMPGFNCTITPTSSSSKIMIVVGIGAIHQDSGTIMGKVQRGSTDIGVGDANGNRPRSGFRMYGSNIYNTNHCGSYHFTFLDSPATTSATTYKLVTAGESGTSYPVYLNRGVQDSDNSFTYRSTTISTMTLYEVSA
tara:strand:- start:397 stop:939 length:543 start_codon:yes stop_codon:yes gene_type:complete